METRESKGCKIVVRKQSAILAMKSRFTARFTVAASAFVAAVCALSATAAQSAEVTFSTAFEGGTIGRIEKLNESTFRVHVLGQQDQRGRNRAATLYCFRMDHVQRRDLTITLTDFVGEYNDVPGSCPMNEKLQPAMREDVQRLIHAESMT